jgi:histidyl-tRNA synthetase
MTDKNESKLIEPRRLKGFRDLMPDLMEKRSFFQQIVREEAKIAGFREVGTPALEYLETLLGQGGEETDKQVYRFEDHGGRKVGLRFDLTVPFARFVGEHQGTLIFPFKRLQIGDVWRGENTQKGRYREFCQCDLDIIGIDSVNADVEVLACFYRTLTKFDLKGFTIRLGHRVLLTSLIKECFSNIDADSETKALIAIDKLDKIGTDGVKNLLKNINGANSTRIDQLLEVISSKDQEGGTDRTKLKEALKNSQTAMAELGRLETILSVMKSMADFLPGGKVVLDCTIARGLGYYTGVVFETTLDRLPGFGSIGSGGRYDQLAERFTTRKLPGVGGSIGLDRILGALDELGELGLKPSKMVFIALATSDALPEATRVLELLRSKGIACDIGLTTGKVGQQFKHADRLGCPFVIVFGTEEVSTGTFSVKNMKTGEEKKSLPVSQVVEKLRELLAG